MGSQVLRHNGTGLVFMHWTFGIDFRLSAMMRLMPPPKRGVYPRSARARGSRLDSCPCPGLCGVVTEGDNYAEMIALARWSCIPAATSQRAWSFSVDAWQCFERWSFQRRKHSFLYRGVRQIR